MEHEIDSAHLADVPVWTLLQIMQVVVELAELDEIRGLLARGIPETARPFGGLVYRQALEHLHGVRDEAATRALIAQQNRQYARRQLIWFRKEPNLNWLEGPGESAGTIAAAIQIVERRLRSR